MTEVVTELVTAEAIVAVTGPGLGLVLVAMTAGSA